MRFLASAITIFTIFGSQIGLAQQQSMKDLTRAYRAELLKKSAELSELEMSPCDTSIGKSDSRLMLFLADAGELGLIELTTPQISRLRGAATYIKSVGCRE